MNADRPPPPPLLEPLLTQAIWLRGLACALVRDADAADDLAQDAWVVAMRSPAPVGVPPRAWLAGIVRNLARVRIRSSARRAARESRAATPEALPGADELAERLDVQRRLAAMVAELREPFRSVVLLRYYEGLDSSEISRRLGEPPGTVRWRLKQALDELRGRLDDANGGDRRRWAMALAPLPERAIPTSAPPSEVAYPLLIQGVAMTFASKLVVTGVAVVLFGAGGFWLANGRETPVTANEGAAPAHAPIDERAELAHQSNSTALAVSPVSSAMRVDDPNSKVTATATDVGGARVVGRLVDTAGRPATNASIRVGGTGRPSPTGLDARFSIDLPVARDVESITLEVSARGCAMRLFHRRFTRGTTTDLGDIPLAPGVAVTGHVVDDLGAPVPAAWIVVASQPVENADEKGWPSAAAPPVSRREIFLGPDGTPSSMLEPSPYGPTFVADADGAFQLDSIPVGGRSLLRVGAMGHRHASVVVTADAGHDPGHLRIVVPRLTTDEGIEGRVLAPDGSPAANCEFLVNFAGGSIEGDSMARTDATGRFHLETLDETIYSVRVADAARGWISPVVGDLRPGRRGVDVATRIARTLRVAARTSGGRAIDAFTYEVTLELGALRSGESGVATATTPGRFLEPVGQFTLSAQAPGFAVTTLEHLDPASISDIVNITLRPLPDWRGVVRASGRPVAGAEISIHRAVDPGHVMFTKEFPLTRQEEAAARATTDADGEFRATLREKGRYLVRATARGFAPGESAVFEVDPESGGLLPPVELGRGGAIEGTVRTGGKQPPDGQLVGAARGDGVVYTTKATASGAYRFDGLTPGPWMVKVLDDVPEGGTTIYMSSDAPIDWNCEVREGVTTLRDLGVGAGARCVIRGRLGVPAGRAWAVALAYADAERGQTDDKSVAIGADGTYELATDRTGDFHLLFMTESLEIQMFVPVRIAAGDQRVDLSFDLGTVVIAPGGAAADVSRMLVWEGPIGSFALARVSRSERDAAAGTIVPSGRVRIVQFDSNLKERDPRKWPTDAIIDVPAGGTKSVEIK